MFRKKKILALVPARGGSKGIKNKNLKKIKNASLISYVANFIKRAKLFDGMYVSTDNKNIAKESVKCGLNVITRPKKISGGNISDHQVMIHALKKKIIKDFSYDYVVYLQPTSPIRKISHLKKTLDLVIKNQLKGSWSISPVDLKYHPLKILRIKNEKLFLFDNRGANVYSRQKLDKVFIRNGVFYIFAVKQLLMSENIFLDDIYPSLTNYKTVNIDNLSDLRLARKVCNQ